MLLISQNMGKYDLKLPKDAILRINLAWCNSLEELEGKLAKNKESEFFIDLPVERIKPPNNKYAIEDLVSVVNSNQHIRYLAISNVESDADLEKYVKLFQKNLIIKVYNLQDDHLKFL